VPKTRWGLLLVVNCVLLAAYVLNLLRCLGNANCCSSNFSAMCADINFEECSLECIASSYKCRRQRSGTNSQWFCCFMSNDPVGHSHRAWGAPRRKVQLWTCGSVRDMLMTEAEFSATQLINCWCKRTVVHELLLSTDEYNSEVGSGDVGGIHR